MADCTTKRNSRPTGGQQQSTGQPGRATSGQQSSFQQTFKQGSGPVSHTSGKGAQQGARSFTPMHAIYLRDGLQEGVQHQCHLGATGTIGAFPGTTFSRGRGARSSVACLTNC